MDSKIIGYAIRFNEMDSNGDIIKREAVNPEIFEQLKISGNIIDYEIDENGVKIIKKFDLKSVSI